MLIFESETTSNENSMDSASNAIESRLKDEWWQLFDAHTKRFYYYNARRELTQWQRPTADSTAKRTPFDSTDNITTSSTSMIESSLSDNTKANMVSSNATTVCLLASRLLALLMSQLDLDRVCIWLCNTHICFLLHFSLDGFKRWLS